MKKSIQKNTKETDMFKHSDVKQLSETTYKVVHELANPQIYNWVSGHTFNNHFDFPPMS